MLNADALALLQAEAAHTQAAVALTGRRHLRLEAAPLVLVPLSLAGEDGALLAFGWGRDPRSFRLHVCPEPRERDLAWAHLQSLSKVLCDWLEPLAQARQRIERSRTYAPEAALECPQLVVPTPAAATLLRRLSERMVWSGGDDRVGEVVVRAGGWLMFFADRHELVPADHVLLIMTEALQMHWVAPISAAEGAHILALTAALDPPAGMSPIDAARAAELESGSTLTTPDFDRVHLEPAIDAYNAARRRGDTKGQSAAVRTLERLLRPIVDRMYRACHQGLRRLRGLPAIIPCDDRRWDEARISFVRHANYLDGGGHFARRDSLRRGLFLIDDAEAELARVEREARYYDPLVRAIASIGGDALEGTVERCEDVRLAPRRFRLQIDVRAAGPWEAISADGFELVWNAPGYMFELDGVAPRAGDTVVSLSTNSRAARTELSSTLRRGSRIAFVASGREYPRLGGPKQPPWMLRARA